MAPVIRGQPARPELLGRLQTGANAFGVIGTRRFLQLLGDGSHHFIRYNAVGEAEHLDVTDLGVTIRSLASIRFPTGSSFWEWEPNGTERLKPLSDDIVPTRCGVLVIADATGQRGILHYADYRPGTKLHGRSLTMVYPIAVTFDLRDDCEQPHTVISLGDEGDFARRPELPPEQQTAFDVETSPKDAAAFMRHFGMIPSPLYKADHRLAFPQNSAAFTEEQWDLFRSIGIDLIHEVMPFMCMQLVIRAPHIRTWRANAAKSHPRVGVTFYDTEVLS